MASVSDVRPSPIAGAWYSADSQLLSRQLEQLIDHATIPDLPGQVLGLIAPHAGYRYSGRTAAHAYKAVRGQHFDLVVVLSPLHDFHPAPFLTSAHKAYATPLGKVEVDSEAVSFLHQHINESEHIGLFPIANDREHSLEIELPFLQIALSGSFQLLPVMIRSLSAPMLRALGQAVAKLAESKTLLLVASTDLSHFNDVKTAQGLDTEMLHQMETLDPNGVLETERRGSGYACGAGAVAAMLWASLSLGADRARILHYSTSADETGDRSSVVGYGAVAICKTL